MNTPIHFAHEVRGNPDRKYSRAVTHNWEIEIEVPPEGMSFNETEMGAQSGCLNVNCQSVSPPNSNISTIEGNVRGVRFHQIQTRASTQIQTNLIFYEPHEYPIYRFFEQWKTIAVDRFTAAQKTNARIPKGIKIKLYDTDRQNVVLEYLLYDTYCGAAQVSDPNNSSAFQLCTVTLISSNYGIIAYDAGAMTFAITDEASGYLGTEGNWVSTKSGKQYSDYTTVTRS